MKIWNKIWRFFFTLFIHQNKWHRFSVLIHTLAVVSQIIKARQYRMIAAGFLHDIGKPFSANKSVSDPDSWHSSFTNHEELSYQIIKHWPFVSDYSKNLVRYHYIIRGIEKAKARYDEGLGDKWLDRYNKQIDSWDLLDDEMKAEIAIFMKLDDLGKQSF